MSGRREIWEFLPHDEVKENVEESAKGNVEKYYPLNRLESRVPWVCIILYAVLIVGWVVIFFGLLPLPAQVGNESMNMTPTLPS